MLRLCPIATFGYAARQIGTTELTWWTQRLSSNRTLIGLLHVLLLLHYLISPHLLILWTLLSHLHVVRFKFKFGALNTCRVMLWNIYIYIYLEFIIQVIPYHIYIYTWIHEPYHTYLFGMIQVISAISQSYVPRRRPTCPTGRSPWHRCGAPNLRPCWPSALALRDLFFCGLEKNMFLYGKPHLYKCFLKTKRKNIGNRI